MQLPHAQRRLLGANVKSFVVSSMGAPSGWSKARLANAGMCNTLLARAATVQGNKGISADVFVLGTTTT